MSNSWKIVIAVVVTALIVGGGGYFYLNNKATKEKEDLQSQIDELNQQIADLTPSESTATDDEATADVATTSPSTVDTTADWKTYTNLAYKFSFKYPSAWNISEAAENFNDARKYIVKLNLTDGIVTDNSILVEVYDMGGLVTLNFINEYFGGIEGGPSGEKDVVVNGQHVVEFIMVKANTTQQVSSGHIMFTRNPSAGLPSGVDISTSSKTGDVLNDAMLNKIAGTFSFVK